jgi:hypothetical protein
MYKFAIALALSCILAACGKSPAPNQPGAAPSASPTASESQKDEALKGFLDRKATRVRSLSEIEADEKAKAKEAENAPKK